MHRDVIVTLWLVVVVAKGWTGRLDDDQMTIRQTREPAWSSFEHNKDDQASSHYVEMYQACTDTNIEVNIQSADRFLRNIRNDLVELHVESNAFTPFFSTFWQIFH